MKERKQQKIKIEFNPFHFTNFPFIQIQYCGNFCLQRNSHVTRLWRKIQKKEIEISFFCNFYIKKKKKCDILLYENMLMFIY